MEKPGGEWSSDFAEPLDETPVEGGKSNKHLNVSGILYSDQGKMLKLCTCGH